MPSLRPQDRVSLCRFSFSDGRRCLTPRSTTNANFCFHHAQQEAQAQAAEKLGQDLAYFFSGNYLSACDLSSALARLLAAVARGHIKPRQARTMAYLAQTLAQTIHISQDEYINAFGTDAWRQAVRNSVKQNANYAAPPTNSAPPPVARASACVPEARITPDPPTTAPTLTQPAAPPQTTNPSPTQPPTPPPQTPPPRPAPDVRFY